MNKTGLASHPAVERAEDARRVPMSGISGQVKRAPLAALTVRPKRSWHRGTLVLPHGVRAC